MADNLFASFPWVAIKEMTKLRSINFSRNRLTCILNDSEKAIFNKLRKQKPMKSPFSVFKKLTKLDLSSNMLMIFPEDLIHLPLLKQLNLMNN